eukprot:c43663_g1_i1 orf=105-344(+)
MIIAGLFSDKIVQYMPAHIKDHNPRLGASPIKRESQPGHPTCWTTPAHTGITLKHSALFDAFSFFKDMLSTNEVALKES